MNVATSQQVLKFVSEKKGDDAFSAAADAAAKSRTQLLKSEALRNIAKVLMASAGVGIAGRSAYGLAQVAGNALRTPPSTAEVPLLRFPVPRQPEKEKRSDDRWGAYLSNLLAGNKADTLQGIPWYLPVLSLAGAGGALAGWQGAGALLTAQKHREGEDDLADAEREFRKAIAASHDKQASDDPPSRLGGLLDRLYEQHEKQAGSFDNTVGTLAGLYGAYAIPTALTAGLAAYHAAEGGQRRKALEEALKRRQRQRAANRPPFVMFVPEDE